MEDRKASLAFLEHHLSILFSGKSGNQEIQQIQQSLDSFGKQKGAWKDALYFLSNSNNHNIFMYGLTILEGTTRQWNGLSSPEKHELRITLYHWLLEKHNNIPFFVRNKAVQLVVQIGRSDWPLEYPEFYDNILSLISSRSSANLGLLFLLTASEELGTLRNDVLSQRKEALRLLLLQYMPQTFSILTALLQSAWERYSHSIVSTPPPSPTNSNREADVKNGGLLITQETETIARLVLQCFTHFFSWIPIANYVTPYLLELIFHFVRIGAEESLLPQLKSSSEPSISVAALGAINEILYRNFIPLEVEEFVCVLFKHTCMILQKLVESLTAKIILTQPSQQFIEKIIELVHLLVSGHMQRLEKRQSPDFNIPHLLSLFFKLTFEEVDWDRYLSCLETWQSFLAYVKHLVDTATRKSPPGEYVALFSSYSSSLLPLSERVLHKILYMHNAVKLEELDGGSRHGETDTEFQKVVQLSADIILASAELTNNQSLSLLTEPFQRCVASYESVAGVAKSSGGVLQVNPKSQLKELRYVLKDLSTLLQLMGRLNELHMNENSPLANSQSLVETLLNVASYGMVWTSLKTSNNPDGDLKSLLIDIHVRCLSSLQTWSFWLSEWIRIETSPDAVINVITAFVDSAAGALSTAWCATSTAERVFAVGIELLGSLINATRSPLLWACPSWKKLYVSIYEFQHLPPQIHRRFIQLILGSSVMSWRDCSLAEQHWEERHSRFQADVDRATSSAKSVITAIILEPTPLAIQQGKPLIISTLRLLADLASMAREETTHSKRATWSVILPWIDSTLAFMPICMTDEEITEEICHLYLTIFDGLLQHVGFTLADKIIRTILDIYSQRNIELALKNENPHGIKAIEQYVCQNKSTTDELQLFPSFHRLIKLFQIIIREPAAAFRKFLPQILSICLDNIYPFVLQASAAHDMKEAFFQLLHLILSHHWRHFFKGSVLSTFQSPTEACRNEEVDNRAHFLTILNAFGQSFVSAELSVFKQNLEAMQSLNSKWKLYSKEIFRDIAPHFIHTLLNVMASGFHDLLNEDIALAIYAMASPKFEAFFRETLPEYLTHCEGLEDSQRLALKNSFSNETDLPTFSKHVQQFVYDLACYRTANSARV